MDDLPLFTAGSPEARLQAEALARQIERQNAERELREMAEQKAHDRMRVHEADLSPPDMAGQSCWSLAKHIPRLMGSNVLRVLDPTAGAGCFPMAIREQWPGTEVVACEAREEEERHLRHHAHTVHMGDFFKANTGGGFDLIVTNPPFSLIPMLLVACLELVVPGGYVAFVCRMSWGNSKETHPLLMDPRLLGSHEFADRWKFRVGKNPKTGKEYSSDSVGYRLLIWQRPASSYQVHSGAVRMVPLPWLPLESRRWRKTQSGLWVKPGTEYLCATADPLETLPVVPWRSCT